MLRNRAWVGGIALLLALHAPVYAANKGTIRFVGSIVESTCDITPNGKGFHSSCYRDGDYLERAHSVLKSGDKVSLPTNVADVHLKPIDGHPNLGHLVINYH
ncbi:MAG: type 1 fimbrial protein [Hafnia alvei]|jgi:type 1 fimbria pilin|uniref:Type 1 fimbrial protein n=1 Tax=Hafnia alvei TaxID=569 RepID=A0ABD7Q233_HAFAL|nr:type 1 fimbrial protein [Hafnia alvei]NEY27786.1 type 1 fimbrial protein [Escherichia coli]ANC41840.1 hypothetical protein A6V27_16385 [Hafnia alvei]KAA0263760.1 type 1 fimbrial protein [Hafnia alvei]KID05376.1 hypothetical protein PU00_03875 [Hafnia alvei]MBI0274768.1 type 1 fimbrial protein [Hafnia alvei]